MDRKLKNPILVPDGWEVEKAGPLYKFRHGEKITMSTRRAEAEIYAMGLRDAETLGRILVREVLARHPDCTATHCSESCH